jgi:hypothetical protein
VVALLPTAAATSVGPYAAAMAVGFIVGAFGHVIHSRTSILTGIAIVGFVSAYFAFAVGKLA